MRARTLKVILYAVVVLLIVSIFTIESIIVSERTSTAISKEAITDLQPTIDQMVQIAKNENPIFADILAKHHSKYEFLATDKIYFLNNDAMMEKFLADCEKYRFDEITIAVKGHDWIYFNYDYSSQRYIMTQENVAKLTESERPNPTRK